LNYKKYFLGGVKMEIVKDTSKENKKRYNFTIKPSSRIKFADIAWENRMSSSELLEKWIDIASTKTSKNNATNKNNDV
jgi:hypothetical protein